MQSKGVVQLKGAGSCYGATGSPHRPSVPLKGALFNCLIVGHSPGFNCIGPRGGASKTIGLGRTHHIDCKAQPAGATSSDAHPFGDCVDFAHLPVPLVLRFCPVRSP